MKVLDLFCGCGGFSLGFEMAGFDVKYGIDHWEKCRKTFEYNHPNTKFILKDIREINPKKKKFKKIDIIIGSPPCQEFSTANNNPDPNKGMELVNVFLRFVKEIKPKYWIMENVPGVLKYLKRRIANFKIPRILILNSANYGVPQKRRRCFAGKYFVPKITHSKLGDVNLFREPLEKWKTVLEAIGDIIMIKPNQDVHIYKHMLGENWKKKYKPLGLEKSSETIRTKMSEHHYLKFSNHNSFNSVLNPNLIGEVQSYKILDENEPSLVIDISKGMGPLIPNHNCFDNLKNINYDSSNREVKLDGPSTAITTKDRNNKKLPILTHIRNPETSLAHSPFYSAMKTSRVITTSPQSIIKNTNQIYRRLTVRECARLQSFPDDFIFFGSLSNQYKMVGNAVPPLMAYALAKAIKRKYEK